MNKRFTPLEITRIRRRDKENKSLTGFNVPKKVVIGGTFDILHKGHKALLRKAFKLVEEDKSSSFPFAVAREVEEDKSSSSPFAAARAGEETSSLLPPRSAWEGEEISSLLPPRSAREGEVTIGLTSDAMARKRKRRKIEDFKHRKKELEDFIAKEFKVEPKIVKIEDKFGPTLKKDFNYIVVSPATYPTATLINKARQKRNKKPIKIVKIEFVLAEDGKPISTTKILKGEIDRDGNLLR